MRPVARTLNIDMIALSDHERRARLALSLILKHALLIAIGFKFRRMRSSMLYANERGRPIEIAYLKGEIVRRGERLGFPTPSIAPSWKWSLESILQEFDGVHQQCHTSAGKDNSKTYSLR